MWVCVAVVVVACLLVFDVVSCFKNAFSVSMKICLYNII